MASSTKKTEKNRERRDSNQGKRRKAKLRTQGSTKTPAELFGDE